MTDRSKSVTSRQEAARKYLADLQEKARTGQKPMRLGELIDALTPLDGEANVRFDRGEKPSGFDSWRGSYEMLSLAPDGTGPFTVAELLSDARAVDGDTREGYKGGTFHMDRETFVWADAWGECPGRAVLGVDMQDGEAVILTDEIDTDPAIGESFYG